MRLPRAPMHVSSGCSTLFQRIKREINSFAGSDMIDHRSEISAGRLVGRAAAGGCLRRVRRRGGVGPGSGSGRVGFRCIGGLRLHGPALDDVDARRARERRHCDGGQEEHDEEHAGAGHCDAAAAFCLGGAVVALLLCVATAMTVRGGARIVYIRRPCGYF